MSAIRLSAILALINCVLSSAIFGAYAQSINYGNLKRDFSKVDSNPFGLPENYHSMPLIELMRHIDQHRRNKATEGIQSKLVESIMDYYELKDELDQEMREAINQAESDAKIRAIRTWLKFAQVAVNTAYAYAEASGNSESPNGNDQELSDNVIQDLNNTTENLPNGNVILLDGNTGVFFEDGQSFSDGQVFNLNEEESVFQTIEEMLGAPLDQFDPGITPYEKPSVFDRVVRTVDTEAAKEFSFQATDLVVQEMTPKWVQLPDKGLGLFGKQFSSKGIVEFAVGTAQSPDKSKYFVDGIIQYFKEIYEASPIKPHRYFGP